MSVYKENMTDAMLRVYDGFQEEMEKECLFCLERLKEANIAENVRLPHTTERGTPVLHGARMVVGRIGDYWYTRLQNASRFVSREFEDKYELYNRRAGIDRQNKNLE